MIAFKCSPRKRLKLTHNRSQIELTLRRGSWGQVVSSFLTWMLAATLVWMLLICVLSRLYVIIQQQVQRNKATGTKEEKLPIQHKCCYLRGGNDLQCTEYVQTEKAPEKLREKLHCISSSFPSEFAHV